MEVKDVKDFCQFEVYEIIGGEVHTICVCKEYNMADLICQVFAEQDPKGDTYSFKPITEPDTFIPGGGWSISYHKDKSGHLIKNTLG